MDCFKKRGFLKTLIYTVFAQLCVLRQGLFPEVHFIKRPLPCPRSPQKGDSVQKLDSASDFLFIHLRRIKAEQRHGFHPVSRITLFFCGFMRVFCRVLCDFKRFFCPLLISSCRYWRFRNQTALWNPGSGFRGPKSRKSFGFHGAGDSPHNISCLKGRASKYGPESRDSALKQDSARLRFATRGGLRCAPTLRYAVFCGFMRVFCRFLCGFMRFFHVLSLKCAHFCEKL
jgi:hypothetical protein